MLIYQLLIKSDIRLFGIIIGNVSVNIESREYNGRWYTDIRAWRLQPKQEAAAAPMPDMPPIAEEPSYASAPAQVDDLPF